LFGIAELLLAAETKQSQIMQTNLSRWRPEPDEMRPCIGAIGRGTVVGFFLGLIPGVGAVIPTFMAYVLEKRVSKHPERFGNGAIEGVATAETANNAYANAAMVPLFALGIPSSPTIAVLMGAFIVNGLTPGPFLFKERPELVWAVIASFFIGNVMLLILNLPLVGLWAKLLKLPFRYMCTGVLIFCVLGAYSLKQSMFDVWVMLGFGVLGYVLRKLDFPLAPAILALILGPMMEKSLRTTLEISGGSFAIFLDRPVALGLLVIPVLLLLFIALKPKALAPLRTADTD
jgi:putative tricarboxylic transport membrane protein